MLTYKGRMVKNEKSFEELMKENVYLTSMLKQKEGQLEEAERHWKKQFEQMVEQVTQSDEDDNASIPGAQRLVSLAPSFPLDGPGVFAVVEPFAIAGGPDRVDPAHSVDDDHRLLDNHDERVV